MPQLKDKVKIALDEARMLILGAQILLGFQYRGFLEPGVDSLPRSWHYIKLLGLVLVLMTICLLMWPATFQQLAERGEATGRLNHFANRIMCWALLPFAMALGIDFFITFGRFGGTWLGVAGGAAASGTALFFWYVLGFWQRSGNDRGNGSGMTRRRRVMFEESQESKEGDGKVPGTPLKDKINDVLTEGRVILPGAQAVLGFQLIAMLAPGFDKLPGGSQYVHLASLALMALSTILLMTVPAYHRIVENGEDTPRFFRFASRILLTSMVPLAAGMSGDFFVVARKVTDSAGWSAAASASLFGLFFAAWFGYTFYRRSKLPTPDRSPVELAGAA